ncbi:MAG: SUMF1/EgtB/PvdO family nonheme iron enzyme, partial [Verrucomicrobia bacterium]|nr:SUMF1/EgtB/PvdO family nonheme iron enzyme [Verrucomicrobiota bacterium]
RFFVGEWQVGRPNRSDFTINLYDDFTARNSELKSGGTWMHVNGEARITWGISGWRNTIRREGEDFRKLGFGPGKSFDDTPTDTGAAVKIKPGASQVQSSTASAAAGSSAPTPAAVAPQPAAQSGQAWINSLGMRFVPVSGTSVQFSIWDTRVQDYQAFVRATGRSWSKPEFKQGPTHPAVNIKWNDAKAFCAWLTEKERRAGTLNSTQEYRLPTDLEWSVAVGLEHETGNTPGERNHSIEGVYPWGTQWPPPRGAGNYFSTLNVDDFANTSPVGSFAANRFGLYDMGGNVWQWCEDYYDGVSGTHFLRGGNFGQAARGGMLSSFRAKYDSDQFGRRDQGNGFRCVLAGGGASTSR